jgi:hypothetical protein
MMHYCQDSGNADCNLSHGLVEASEYNMHPAALDPVLGSSVVKAPTVYLGISGGAWVRIPVWSFFLHMSCQQSHASHVTHLAAV